MNGKITVQLELFAFLQKYSPKGYYDRPFVMELPANSSARALIKTLNIPDDIPVLVYVNSRQIEDGQDHRLSEGDVVGVMPVIPGG